MQKKRITLYVGEDSYFQLKVYAISQRESVSQIIDGWIQGFLAKNKYGISERKDKLPQQVLVEKIVKTFKESKKCPHLVSIGGICRSCPGGLAV